MKIETEEYMTIERRESVKAEARKLRRQFLRYKEAEIVYSMQHKKILELADRAGALYRIDGYVLINRDIFDHNKGKTVAQCLKARIDYAENGEKTEEGEFISSYACDPKTAEEEFMLSKKEYFRLTGRIPKGGVIAYQVRQKLKEKKSAIRANDEKANKASEKKSENVR